MKSLTRIALGTCISAPLLGLMACGTSTTAGTVTSLVTAYTTSYNSSGVSEIVGFHLNSATESATVTIPASSANDQFIGLAKDSTGNLYTVDQNYNSDTNEYACSIVEFAPVPSSNATPSHKYLLDVSSNRCDDAAGVAVDDVRGQLYFMTFERTYRFLLTTLASTASGSAAEPAARVSIGSDYGAYAFDTSGNLYVAPYDSNFGGDRIQVLPTAFASNANSLKTIYTASTFDYIDNLTIVGNNLYVAGVDQDNNGLLNVYPTTSTHSPTASQSIAGSNTKLNVPAALYVDSTGIYEEDRVDGNSGSQLIVNRFSLTSNGNVAPAATVTTPLAPIDGDNSGYSNAIVVVN